MDGGGASRRIECGNNVDADRIGWMYIVHCSFHSLFFGYGIVVCFCWLVGLGLFCDLTDNDNK